MELLETPQSSTMETVRYLDDEKILEVHFRENHRIYHYYKVPPEVWLDFKRAESKGTYLNTIIKGRFNYKKIG